MPEKSGADKALLDAAATVTDLVLDGGAELVGHRHSADELTQALADRAAKSSRYLVARGESVPRDQYPLLAAAALSRSGNHVSAQTKTLSTVERFVVYRRFADLPLSLLLRGILHSKENEDDPAANLVPLGEAWRALRDIDPMVPRLFTTMVAAALTLRAGIGTKLGEVLERGLELAGRYRAELSLDEVERAYPVLGNADIVVQIAAFRAAVDEACGAAPRDPGELVNEAGTILRRAMNGPLGHANWRLGDEPDGTLAFRAFARFIGDGDRAVARLFQQLNPELDALTLRDARNEYQVDWQAERQTAETAGVPEQEQASDHAERVTGWLVSALCLETSATERAAVLAWIRRERATDSQDQLPALVVALRRADLTLRRLPPGPPPAPAGADARALAEILLPKVESALRLGDRGTEVLTHVLPPLWTHRAPAVKLVERRLFLELGAGYREVPRAALVAATVVRGPAQRMMTATGKDLAACPCGARSRASGTRKVVPSAVDVCPHRRWDEPGRVEDYRTLTEASGYATPEATRRQLHRYQGPWYSWVSEALEP